MKLKKRYILSAALGITVLGASFISAAEPFMDTADNGLKIKILKEKATIPKTEDIILRIWENMDSFNEDGYYYLNGDICHIVVKSEADANKLKELNKKEGMVSNIKIDKGSHSMKELELTKEDVEIFLNEMNIETYGVEIDFKKENIKVKAPDIKEAEKEELENQFKGMINIVSKYDIDRKEIDAKDFEDVDSSHWAYDAIKYLQKNGIASGNEDNTYRPEEPIMREDVMTLAYKAIGAVSIYKSVPELSKVFADQSDVAQYAEKAIRYFEGTNSINGYPDGTIRPKDNIKRAEAAVFLSKAFSFKLDKDASSETLNYSDVSTDDYYYGALQKLKKCGAFSGEGEYRPEDDISRAEFSYMLYKVCSY